MPGMNQFMGKSFPKFKEPDATQNTDSRHQTSDPRPKANHRGHGELKLEGPEMIEVIAHNDARHE
jgi:hypothetical protein